MLALKIEVDGKAYVTAGAEDWALLSLHDTANRGESASPTESVRADRIDLSLGGLSQPDSEAISQHIRWGRLDLSLESKVTVSVVEADTSTPPIRRYRSDSKVQEQLFTEEEMREFRWKDYLELKKEFEGNSAA